MQSLSNLLSALKPTRLIALVVRARDNLRDQRQNRECIGEDRFGNKYYQYYSYYGLPIRREIRFKNEMDLSIKDLVYYRWLHNQEFDPPTEAEKQQFYLEEKQRYERALEWDRKEQIERLEMRRRREELLLRDQALKELEQEMLATSKLTDIKTKRQVEKLN